MCASAGPAQQRAARATPAAVEARLPVLHAKCRARLQPGPGADSRRSRSAQAVQLLWRTGLSFASGPAGGPAAAGFALLHARGSAGACTKSEALPRWQRSNRASIPTGVSGGAARAGSQPWQHPPAWTAGRRPPRPRRPLRRPRRRRPPQGAAADCCPAAAAAALWAGSRAPSGSAGGRRVQSWGVASDRASPGSA